jgi:glycosyltransferase involved in cell wall biosynthesis
MKVSVILTSYNHARYLRSAIESVLSQTFPDFELIVWDDASTDESWEIINSYKDERIRAFRNPVNMHRGNINRGLEQAQGEYIAIHHSDDVWKPEKLEEQVAILDSQPEIGAVFSDVIVIDEQGSILPEGSHPYQTIFAQPNRTRHEWLNYFFYRGNALCHPTALVRKRCYDEVGGYRYNLGQSADFDMWIRLCMKYEIHILAHKLIYLRVHSNNMSGNRLDVRLRGWYEYFQILHHYTKLEKIDDFLKIFPAVTRKWLQTKGFIPSFVLAMAALEPEQAYNITRLFGLNLLFNLMNEPDSARQVEEIYNFTYKDFIALEGKYDVFFLEAVEQLKLSLAQKDALLGEKDALLAQKDALLGEKDALLAQKDALLGEKDALLAQKDALLTETQITLQNILQSRSWKIVSMLRKIGSISLA